MKDIGGRLWLMITGVNFQVNGRREARFILLNLVFKKLKHLESNHKIRT